MRIKLALKTLAAQNPYLVAHSTEGRWVFCFVLQVRAFLCYKTLSGWKKCLIYLIVKMRTVGRTEVETGRQCQQNNLSWNEESPKKQ